MAYNNGFPVTYPQMYYQPQYQPQIPQQPPAQQNNGIIWVQGEAGAKSFLVAPNTTVQLWDSESQCIYLKSADASGMPSMKILDYTIRNQTPANAPMSASNVPTVNGIRLRHKSRNRSPCGADRRTQSGDRQEGSDVE